MIILHRKCDRIVRSSRPVIADSLYHEGFFCLPLFGKKVAELCCTNVCKTDKNREKHLSNFSKYSIHLKHSKHPFVQKIALYRTKMTANLQNKSGSSKGAALSQYESNRAHFMLRTKQLTYPAAHFAPKMKNRSRDFHHAPKGVADFAARRRQIILIVFWRDMRVPKNSSHGAECARLRRVHAAQCNLLKKRGRLSPSSFFEVFTQAPR